jgi:membrane-bound ClpP family serine protease
MKTYLLICLICLLAACQTSPQVQGPDAKVDLVMDKNIQPMTRNEIIMAINECEANNTRAVVINSRRKINNYSTEVTVDVTCAPKYRF